MYYKVQQKNKCQLKNNLFLKVFVINQVFEEATKSGFYSFLMIGYCRVHSFIVAGLFIAEFSSCNG